MEGLKYVQTRLYVKIVFIQESVRALLETAYEQADGFSEAISDTDNSRS